MLETEIILINMGKISSKREKVTTACLGDYDGTGEKKIILGGGKSERNTQLMALKNIEELNLPKILHNFKKGYLLETVCFDIDNDGRDEIICGNSEGKLVYLDFKEGVVKKGDIVSLIEFSKAIKSIKVLPKGKEIFIFSSSRDGNIGVSKFVDGNFEHNEKIDLNMGEIWSLLPISIENKIVLIVGGESFLSIVEILENQDSYDTYVYRFPELGRDPDPEDDQERIYDICLIDQEHDKIKFVCGSRSGKIYFFYLNGGLELVKEIKSGKSIYKLNYFDINNCGSKELIAVGEIGEEGEEIGHIEIFNLTLTLCSANLSEK